MKSWFNFKVDRHFWLIAVSWCIWGVNHKLTIHCVWVGVTDLDHMVLSQGSILAILSKIKVDVTLTDDSNCSYVRM
mgnify:CR=1 FL=1